MGAYEEAGYPFLAEEKRLLRRAAEAGVPVLGICLGAQLLADALGGHAHRGPTPELGYHPVRLTSSGERDPVLRHLEQPVLSWHQDTFELPPGAELLAASDAYPQAFRRGRALGVQFHPETPPSLVDAWIESSGREDVRAWGADPDALLAQAERLGGQARRAGRQLLGAWAAGLREDGPRD
jgi:GMP synthase (glutamine-hydrolysing)